MIHPIEAQAALVVQEQINNLFNMRTYLLVFFLIISGCNQKKNNKKQTSNFLNTDTRDLIDNKTIKNENLNYIVFNSLNLSSKAELQYNNFRYSFDLNFGIKKNDEILISGSLILPIFKILIQQDKILAYQKIDKTFFEIDFNDVYKKIGIDLNYNQLESILIGNPVLSVNNPEKFKIYKSSEKFLIYEKEEADVSYTMIFDINSNRLINQEIKQLKLNRYLYVQYDIFEKIDNFYFPSSNQITINDGKNLINLIIENKSKNIEDRGPFEFKIPNNYTKTQF